MPNKKTLPSKKSAKKPSLKKTKNHFLRDKILGIIFLSLALILVIFPIHLPTQKPIDKNPIVINKNLLVSQKKDNNPVKIIIPRANIDLPVIDAPVIDGFWETSETSASYGLGSGQPGEKNNTVIFAHAREGLFYDLKNVKLNDKIYVFTKNKWYTYKVNKITAVFPNDTTVIQPTINETLTLYTCTGFNDEKRLIVTAIPQS